MKIFDVIFCLYMTGLRYTTTEGQWKASAVRLTNHLANIRGIINHFSPKVDSWAAANQLSSLTEDQVSIETFYQEIQILMHEYLRPKRINYMFLRHTCITFNPPVSKIFILFPVFTLKNHVVNCQFNLAIICHHLVCF